MQINTTAMNQRKRAETIAQQNHQTDLIRKGLDPNTFNPLRSYYFLTREFEVRVERETNQVYFERLRLGEFFKMIWSDIKFMLAMYTFIVYVKLTKKIPNRYLKPYNHHQNGKSQ